MGPFGGATPGIVPINLMPYLRKRFLGLFDLGFWINTLKLSVSRPEALMKSISYVRVIGRSWSPDQEMCTGYFEKIVFGTTTITKSAGPIMRVPPSCCCRRCASQELIALAWIAKRSPRLGRTTDSKAQMHVPPWHLRNPRIAPDTFT